MIVYDNNLDHQHRTIRKFTRRWFRPYEVRKAFANGTYRLSEVNRTILRVPIGGKWVKIFKKQSDDEPNVILHKPWTEEQLDKDQGSAESEKS